MLHYFTSASTCYLPQARALAESIRRHAPGGRIHLMLCDTPPPGFDVAAEPFDEVLRLEDLGIPELRAWTFSHEIVELCTAVKGLVLDRLLARDDTEAVIYLDPDIAVLGPLDALQADVRRHSVSLTPVLTRPETESMKIESLELGSLLRGVFGLGFVGVTPTAEGRKFGRWWRDRLLAYCFDQPERGLFTDQRWCDLVPCFFEDVGILRSPTYNLGHWKLTGRQIDRTADGEFTVDGERIAFYHFSGHNRGEHDAMLDRHGRTDPALAELRRWYSTTLEPHGQRHLRDVTPATDLYADGSRVATVERLYYRSHADLARRFPDPYSLAGGGYRGWFRAHAPTPLHQGTDRSPRSREDLLRILTAVYESTSWRIGRALTAPRRWLDR